MEPQQHMITSDLILDNLVLQSMVLQPLQIKHGAWRLNCKCYSGPVPTVDFYALPLSQQVQLGESFTIEIMADPNDIFNSCVINRLSFSGIIVD